MQADTCTGLSRTRQFMAQGVAAVLPGLPPLCCCPRKALLRMLPLKPGSRESSRLTDTAEACHV